jgi:putative endonuclease
MPSTKDIGNRGEDLAVAYLEDQGFRLFDRNYRFERAEVDVVAFEPNADDTGGEIVFVEVKTRTSLGYGAPEDAVDEAKQRLIAKAAEAWLHERRLDGAPVRFDVVAVVLRQGRAPDITHHRDAFWGA